ncbi:hypothetical protein EHM69_13340 [candidate division KSB1 bacterium]|nr:MAG: hypothetical protein EHM69_13340 [candidate division KSB1 bacterium]
MPDNNYQTYLTERETPAPPEKKSGLWALLSAMKFAIWVLVILGAFSLAGMFIGELYDPEALRRARGFGPALLRFFDMDDPFRAWWYRLLLATLCLSLFACILERTPILWKLWTRRPPQDAKWLNSIRHGIVRTISAPRADVEKIFSGYSWRVKNELLWVGERGRFGMWGPLCTHIGMLLIGIGALIGSLGGTNVHTGGFAGDVVQLPEMPFAVRVDSFRVVYYPLQPGQWVLVDDDWVGRLAQKQANDAWQIRRMNRDNSEDMIIVPASRIKNQFNSEIDRANIKRYSAYVTVLDNGREVKRQEIAVNSPLRYGGYRFYQSSYDPDRPRFAASFDSLRLVLADSATGKADTITLKPGRETAVPGDTLRVTAAELLPHFKFGQEGAYSETAEFINPAVKLIFRGPRGFETSRWIFLKFPSHESGPGSFTYRLAKLHGERAQSELRTIFEIRRGYGSAFLWLGFIFGTCGLLLSFYMIHRVLYVEWPADGQTAIKLTGIARKMPQLYARQLDRNLKAFRAQ